MRIQIDVGDITEQIDCPDFNEPLRKFSIFIPIGLGLMLELSNDQLKAHFVSVLVRPLFALIVDHSLELSTVFDYLLFEKTGL